MHEETIRWILTIAIGPVCAAGAWFFARRTRQATDTGLELENAGKALHLYEQTVDIAQGQQNRLNDAVETIDAMRIALAECVEARGRAERRELLREQQAKIDKASQDIITASLRREIAELNLRIVSIHGDIPQTVAAVSEEPAG